MGQTPIYDNLNIIGDFICKKCDTQLLIELYQTKNLIFIRSYCFCGTITNNINEYIKSLSNLNNYIYYCRYHREYKQIGFCKTCKIPLCNKCRNNKNHGGKHEIIFYEDFIKKDINDILITYESNLNKAYIKVNELLKLKYGGKCIFENTNLFKPQKILDIVDKEDKEIILCLELLKTFLDIYIYKKNNNTLNYQTIAHIIKHRNFEIIRLNDKEKKNMYDLSKRIISIGSHNNQNIIIKFINMLSPKDKVENINKNIIIYLKIDIKEKEIRKKEINIISREILNKNNTINFYYLSEMKNIILLKNGDLACYSHKAVVFYRNLNENKKYLEERDIIDLVELDNKNICILKEKSINIYTINNKEFQKIKEINLNLNLYEIYYNIKNITENNIALLSYISQRKSILTFLPYPSYSPNQINLLENDYVGSMVQMDNKIIICLGALDSLYVVLYDINASNLEKIKIKRRQSYKLVVKCFKLNKDKILITSIGIGMIFNIKTKQVETLSKIFDNIECMETIGNYILVGKKQIIEQLDIKLGKIRNKYDIFNFDDNMNYNITNIVNIGNKKFCVLNKGIIYLFHYE